jgi:integrase
MHRILKQVLASAARWRMLTRNPVDAVDPPKVERRRMSALDAAETARLLAPFKGTRMLTPTLLAVMCGLRRGEVTALRWGSVDLARGQPSVVESTEQTVKGI